jgi:hypothetical protein
MFNIFFILFFLEKKTCDLFKGHWIKGLRGSSYYTNSSCPTIPDSKNCFKNGRIDSDFLNWKWKPNQCELPMFDPKIFLNMVRGKKMSFIGDSVARNHMDSLLCLLSQVSLLSLFFFYTLHIYIHITYIFFLAFEVLKILCLHNKWNVILVNKNEG